jgi:hypothetical protein
MLYFFLKVGKFVLLVCKPVLNSVFEVYVETRQFKLRPYVRLALKPCEGVLSAVPKVKRNL